ncbi:MAG: TetR/AcrR family transcriptional regulator [Vicinamibacteria bacterium]|jgi:AcrR family transcriptional regulator
MRRKDQAQRRAQLATAARELLLQHGALGLRVKDIAQRAGISPSAVLYYYPDLDDLVLEVSRDAMRRYAERRAEAIREIADPVAQLRVAIGLGVPTGPDDEDSRLLYELDAMTGSSHLFATLSASFFDRQVMLYERVLERGADSGAFTIESDPVTVARGLVALEDGLGLQVVLGHPEIDAAAGEAILLAWAGAATGIDLRSIDRAPA